MLVDSEKKTPTNNEQISSNLDHTDNSTALEILRYSVNELERKQTDIHRHIGQLSAVMSDFEYHMARIRTACQSSNNDLCQSLLSHLDSIILDTRSALIASNNSINDAHEVQHLVQCLYEENQRINEYIEQILKQDQINDNNHTLIHENHIDKAIEHIEFAFEENKREQQRINNEQEEFQNQHKFIENFIQTTDHLHEQALNKLREHIRILRERNQSLKQYNEQIEILTKQLPDTLFLSPQ